MVHRLRLSDGRQLAWGERGDLSGSVVFAIHGLPGSRLQVHPEPGAGHFFVFDVWRDVLDWLLASAAPASSAAASA